MSNFAGRRRQIITRSRDGYARPRHEVEAALTRWQGTRLTGSGRMLG